MTIQAGWADEEFSDSAEDAEDARSADYHGEIVPVKIVFDENERVSPQFCSHMTWPVPHAAPAQMVVPRNKFRYKAKLTAIFPGAGSIYTNHYPDPLSNVNPQGATFTVLAAGSIELPDYDAEQPLYVIASIAGVALTVWDETYGQLRQ